MTKVKVARMFCSRFAFACTMLFAPSQSFAAGNSGPKLLTNLFVIGVQPSPSPPATPFPPGFQAPDMTNSLNNGALWLQTDPVYKDFINCAKAGTDCSLNPNGSSTTMTTPVFLDLSAGTNGFTDTYDQINHCIGINHQLDITMSHQYLGPVVFANTANGITVNCVIPASQPTLVALAHILVCYRQNPSGAVGAYCNLATACFEGPKAVGQCPGDKAGVEVRIATHP